MKFNRSDAHDRLADAIRKSGLTNQQIAKRAMIDPSAISCLTAPSFTNNRLPSYENLVALCDMLHVSTDFVLTGRK